jgi:hypothetical protein
VITYLLEVFMWISGEEKYGSMDLYMANHSKFVGNGCLEWIGCTTGNNGYGAASWCGKRYPAHRLAWLAWVGEIPMGMNVLHKCDNPRCVNAAHLYLGDHFQNMRDKVSRGRCNALKEENNPMSKLNKSDAILIKALILDGYSDRNISKIFKVCPGTIGHIRAGRTWKNV